MNLYNILGGHIVAIKCYVFIKYVLSDSLQKVFVEKNENHLCIYIFLFSLHKSLNVRFFALQLKIV